MLGEAPQGLSPPGFTPHHAAAQSGPHTGTHWTLEISRTVEDGQMNGWDGTGWAGLGGDDRAQNLIHSRILGKMPPPSPAWRSPALKPKTMGCLFSFVLIFCSFSVDKEKNVECFMDFTQPPPATTVPYMMRLCQAKYECPASHPPNCDSWKYFFFCHVKDFPLPFLKQICLL